MRALGRPGLAVEIALLGAVLVPIPAHAQAGFYVTPSVTLTEVYDDNVFVTADRRESDFISRLTPGIEAGYQSAPLTLLGRYTFDAEVYASHSELTTPQARQNASVELRYRPKPPLTISVGAVYLTTETPGEFNTDTGLAVERASARRVSVTPAFAYQLDALTAATGDYTFAADEAGGIKSDLHGMNLGVERRVTPRDTASLTYAFRFFVFPDEASKSHALLLGWTREMTALTTVGLRAGPRVTDGSVDPEIAASVRRKLEHGEVSFAYTRTQSTVIGEKGVVDSQSFGVSLAYRPLPSFEVRMSPAFLMSARGDLEAKVYRVGLEGVYQVTKWLSLTGSYQFSFQQGNLVPGARRDEEIQHNVVTLGLVVTHPYRVR